MIPAGLASDKLRKPALFSSNDSLKNKSKNQRNGGGTSPGNKAVSSPRRFGNKAQRDRSNKRVNPFDVELKDKMGGPGRHNNLRTGGRKQLTDAENVTSGEEATGFF